MNRYCFKIKKRLKVFFFFLWNIKLIDFFIDKPKIIFNHIPKCGGSSFRLILRNWFWVIKDYNRKKEYYQLNKLKKINCLCGHYLPKQKTVFEVYPELLSQSNDYLLLSFVCDPLKRKVSHYYHKIEKKAKIVNCENPISLEDFLFTRPNYMAQILGCNRDNYEEIIQTYFFIGCLDEFEKSIKVLSRLLNKPFIDIEHVNKGNYNHNIMNELDIKKVVLFKEMNELDYLVYHFCKKRIIEKFDEIEE